MDRNLPKNQEIQRLILASAASRGCLQAEVIEFRQRLDFPARLKSSLKAHPSAWVVGALACGFAASLLFRRKPVTAETKQRGLALTLLGLALTAARPFAKVWLTDQVKTYLVTRTGTFRVTPPAARPVQ